MCFPLSKSKRAHAKHFGANICHLKHRLFAPLLRPEDLCYRPEARLLRMVCGATCNCTDPYTNAWWKVTWMQCVKPFLHLKICTHCCQRWWFGNGNSFKTQQFGLFTCSSCPYSKYLYRKTYSTFMLYHYSKDADGIYLTWPRSQLLVANQPVWVWRRINWNCLEAVRINLQTELGMKLGIPIFQQWSL